MEEPGLKERANGITDPAYAIRMIKHYQETIKSQNKKVINIAERQGQLLKNFKDNEIFFETMGQSKWTIYFKISLYEFSKKYQLLKSRRYVRITSRITLKQ